LPTFFKALSFFQKKKKKKKKEKNPPLNLRHKNTLDALSSDGKRLLQLLKGRRAKASSSSTTRASRDDDGTPKRRRRVDGRVDGIRRRGNGTRAFAIFKRLLNIIISFDERLLLFDASSSSSNRSRCLSATARRPMCAPRAFFRAVVFPSLEKTKVLCCD
jgi:hypothetical protein